MIDRLRRFAHRFHRDRSGTSLTEFVIMLPIFLLIFQGIVKLGQFTRKGSEPPVEAYQKTFGKTVEKQKDSPLIPTSSHFHPSSGGGGALNQTWSKSPPYNKSGTVRTVTKGAETAAYGGLIAGGHMDESAVRVTGTRAVADIKGCQGPTTPAAHKCVDLDIGTRDSYVKSNMEGVTGEAPYATDLLDDSPGNDMDQSNASGPLGRLNGFISSTGVRPAIAAGVRYGTVTGRSQRNYSFMGEDMDMRAYYSNLVPPATTGGPNGPLADALRATAVSRLTMQGKDYYAELPGIASRQPLNNLGARRFDVPDLPDYQ